MQEKFLVEDIQPGLLDKTSMSDVFVNDSFPEKYLEVAHFSDTSDIKLPTIQNLVGTVEGNLTTNEKPDFYTNVFKKVGDNLKLKDPTYKNPIYSIDTINPENVLPYVKQDTNYSSNISAAFGQGGKGLVVGATLGAGTGAVATPEFLGLGAIPGSVIGGTIGGVSGFLSGLLNTSGKQDFIIGSNNRQRTAEEQSGFWNRVGGFTNNVIDRSFEAGLGGTAALLSTPFGALAGKDMYDWGDNPLTARLSKGLEESEYKAKLSDNYLSKGPIAKLFTGEGFQNEMADMVGFTVGMMVGTKGLGLLNKGAGILTAPAVEALGFEQKALRMASGEGMLGQVLPTLAKQSSSYFTRGTRLATEGAAAYDEALMFKGWRKGISNTYKGFKTEGVAGGLDIIGKGFTQFPTKFVNFFKDGTNSLNALSAFERTALASYGEARVESAQSYKDIYETALKLGYTGNEAANMATEGANRTLGFNMLLLGMTNQFGLNNIFKSRNVLPDLAKWLTKDYAFDNSTKLFLKNTLKSVGKNMGKGFVIEGFAEELGQFAIGEGSKNYTLDTNNPVYKSFLKEIVNAYTEGITSDEGTSNWFGGGLFGAITGMIGLDGGLLGSFRERKDAKNFEVPLSIRTKMTETNEAIMDIMRHTSAFNGQLYNSYSRDEQGNLVKNNQGNERLVKSPSTVIQLAKALESISTLTKDQVASIVDATSLDELVKNATPQEKKSLENGFNGITAYLDHIDSIKESTDGVAQGFIEFVDKLNTTQRNDVMQTLYALKTSSLTEKAKSAQDIMKQQLLSNYVYDHVSNGVESKLFDELTLLEKTIQDPNANIQDLEFLGKKYQQEEKEQALADIKKQRKDINRQVNIYRNLQLRFGQPLSYEYLRDKEGNIEKHAITVPLKEVFRSAVRQIQIQESLKESKNTLDKELQKIVSVFGENEVLRQLNKGLSGSLENDILAEEILKNANVDYQTKVTLERIKENEDFLNFNLKYENAIFSKLTDAKSIIKNIHNRFKTLQNAIDEKEKIKEEEERLTALKKEEAERKAKAELEEAERKAKEQAEFEEKQRKDKERGVKEAQLKKEREEREAKLKKDQEEKEAQLKKQQEAEDLKKKKKEKERIVNELNRLIPDGFNIKVIGIDDFNVLTFKTKDGEIINSTIEEFENILKKANPLNKYTLEEQKEEALENLKEIFKENAFLYDERELPNVDINKFNTTAVDLYNVAKNILTEQELNKVLEKLSISDVNNLPLNKAIELSIGLKGVLLSRENISDKVDVPRGFSDKSNYDYLINDIPFNNKFKIVTEDSLKREENNISGFISKFVKKLKDNNVGGISNVAYEGHIIQVDYGTAQQPVTSTPKLTKEELKKSNPEFFNKDGNISIADMSNDTFIKFMSGVIFDIKIDEIRSNNSPYRVISDLFYGFGLMDNTSFSSFLISASEETKNYFKEIYNFYQNSTIDNRYRREMEEGLKKYGIQKQIDQINRRTPFKKIDSLSPDEYIKIKLGYAFLHQRYAENRVYSDLVFNPATNQTLFRIPSKQVLDDLNKIIEILKNSQVFKYSEIKEDFLKLENFKNLSEKELIDLYNTKNLTLDNFNSVKNKSTAEQPVTSTSDIEAKKADIEKRRQELESSREIETLYDLRKSIAEDSEEIVSKIEEANKLKKDAQAKSEQAAKETDEEKRIALNSVADKLLEKAQILDKEIKKSRDSVINNTAIKQAINSTKILGQKLLNKIKIAAKSNEWVSSMPISKEEFTKFEDAIKRLSVKDMGEVTSNSEVIPDILLIEEINAKYNAKLEALEQQTSINLVPVSSKEGIEILRNFDSKINNYRILTEYNEELDRALGILNKRSIAAKNKIANEFNTGVVFKNSDLRDDESYSKKFELVEKIIQDTIRKKYEPLFEKSSVDFFTVGKKNSNISVENITDFESVSISLLLSKNDITNVKLIEIVSPYKGIIEFSLKEGETTTAPVIFKKPHEQKEFIKTINNTINENNLSIKGLSSEIAWQKAVARKYSQDGRLKTANKLQEELDSKIEAIGKIRNNLVSQFYDALGIVPDSSLNSNLVEFKDKPKELTALGEGGLSDEESKIPTYENFVKDDNSLPLLTLENLRRTPGFDNRDEGKTEQELENEIASLRAKEQEEIKETIPDIDDFKINGVVNRDFLSKENLVKYDKIYDKYNKIITPLLADLDKLKANLHLKAMRAFYELTQTADKDDFEFVAKIAANIDVTKELYKVWTSQGYLPKPDDVVLLLVDKKTKQPVKFNGSIAYNFLPTHSQFYNSDGSIKNDEDLITALIKPKASGYYAFRFDSILVNKDKSPEEIREAIRLNYLITLKEGLKERDNFIKLIKVAKDGLVVPIEEYKEGIRPKLQGSSKTAMLGSLVNKDDKDLEIERPTKDTKGITRVFYKGEEVIVHRNALDSKDIKYLSELIYDYIKDEIPTNLSESEIEELEKKKKDKKAEIEKLVYFQSIKRNMNSKELSNNAISIDGKILYRGPLNNIVIDTQSKPEALEQIKNLLSGNGVRAIAYHVNRQLLSSNQAIQISGVEYSSYEDFLKTKVLRVNYDYRINAIYARQAILAYPKIGNSPNTISSNASGEITITKKDIENELAKFKKPTATEDSYINDVKNNIDLIIEYLKATPEEESSPKFASTADRPSIKLFVFRYLQLTDNRYDKELAPFKQNFAQAVKEFKESVTILRKDTTEPSPVITTEEKVTKKDKTEKTEATVDPEDKAKKLKAESLAKRKSKGRGAKRAITRSESDSYIRENIEEFRTWLQEVLPQFPVETTKDVIDGIAEGMFYKNVITLWELAEVGTGFHEAFEGVWNTLLTKEQKDELLNEFKQREGSFKYPFSSEILNYSQATDSQIKETIAEEFRQFMLDRKLLNKQPIKNNFFLRLWNYIKDFINSLTNKEIREISKIENLFNEISKGKFKYHNTLSVYSEKEYRLIKEDETYDMSNTVLQTIKSKVFEIFSNTNEDVLLLNKENKDLYNAKLEQIRQELLDYETASAHAEEIKDLYLSEEGFKNYVIPHLSQHLASFKIQVESVEQDENNRDKEGFVESMFIDSKNLVTGSIKTMVHTLIDREYDPTSEQYINRYSIYDYFGDINTFVDGHKVINILQNVLANTPSRVIKDGVSLDAIDLFKIKLESFKNKDGIYPRGYEWIPEFLERVQKNDDLKLAVEKSFVTTKVENSKLYLKNNEIIDLDPIQDETITNQKYKYLDYFKAKYNVDNEIETKVALPSISGKRQNDTFNNLLDFLGIPKDEFNRAKETNPNLYGEYQTNMIEGYLKLKEKKGEALVSVQDIDNFYNVFKGGISSTFKNLLLLNQDSNERQLVYQNADGKKQYSIMNNTTWSTLINVLSLVDTKQDLLDTLPHLANKEGTDFKESLQNSKILNGLFYSRSSEEDNQPNVIYNKGDKKPQGKIDNLKYTLINGVDVDGNEGMVTASLNDVDRVIQQVYYANKGIFYTMVNSDKSSELAINIGQFFGNHENKTEGEFAEYLWNNYAENQLKFYNTYLSDETNTNYDHFSKALKSGNLFWGKVVMTDGLIDIEASKEKVLENLRVSLSGFLKDFRDNANETDLYGIVQSNNGNLAKKIVYNTLLSTIEQHLIIYGDTLFYKLKDGILDSPKRTSAYNATKEAILQSQTHWNALYNKTMRLVPKENNGKFNVESFDDIEVMIQLEKLNAMVYDAYLSIKESHNQDLTEDQIALMLGVDFKFEDGKFVVTNYKTEGYVKAYLEMNEADAQAYILTDFYMDLMYRSGKLNQEQVDSLNWKKAKEIEIRSNLDKENPLYKEYSVMHRYWAKNILENMPNNNEAVIGVLKPQYSGYSENDTLLVPALLKNSVMPLHFIDLYDEKTNTVRYTKAMKAYINAQNNGTDIIGHKSGQKFGSPVDENGKFVPMFKEGEYNDESPIQQTMYESFMGIQSEIPAKRKFEILGGSQIRKIITQNLQALADSGNHPELVQLLQEYNEIVEARYNIGLKELENKLGLTYVNNKYVIENPSKLVDQLKDELNRLNLPDNVKEIIDLNRDRTNLLYKLEGSPNNLSLQSVLLSIVDKTLVHQKVRGKGSPQIASSLFTNDTRSTEKVTINGKEREVMTDSGLGFYYNAEGEAIGMEVLIPNPFYDIYPDLTWEQFEVMMEKDPRLKELAAYRIPTQSLGQFEFIKIKGFYDNSLGDAVIVPSGIVAKAGSDFDIDKLNIYIPHVRLTEDNQLEYIEYLDDSNSTIEERYRKYALARVYEEYSNTINEWFNSIKQSNNELNETYSNLQDVKKENSLTNETFNTLPDIYKKAFWNRNAELNEFNIKGVAKIVDFRNLADRYIELLKDKKDSKSLAIKDKLSTMIVEYDRYLNIDKSIYENFNRIRESYIEEKESFMENKDFVLTSTMLDKGYISKEEFSQLPIPEQNTKKAIENRNIELMNKLATYKTNAFTAMSANNADTLKKLSELYKEKRTDTYLSIGSFMRQVNFRQANLSSKSLVGLAAVHVTGHMITQNGNTQLTGYFINSMGNKEELNIMLSMSYDNFLSLDKVWDTQGNLITSNLSEFLSAIVDAAKDPFIFDLNINAETLNTALYLTRLGVSLADTMRFMSSPIIKQYLKKKRINTSLFKKQINEISKGQALVLVETLNGTTYGNFKNMFGINNLTKLGKLLKDRYIYGDMFFKIGPRGIVYNIDTGLPVIDYNNYEQKLQYVYDSVLEYIGKDNIQNIDPYTNDDLTKTFVLLSYLKYNQQAGYLGNINAATSIDTKAPNTVSISVDLQMKRDSIKKDGFVDNTEDMFTNTFLDTLWKNKEVGLQALSNYQIMADPLFQENYLKPALTVLNRDKYLSTAKKDQIINKFQNFLMTYFLQNYDFENGSINNRKDAIKRDVINNYNEVLKLGEEFKIYKLITKNKVKGNEFENIVKLRSNVNTSDINEAVEELLEYQELFKDSEDQEDRYNAQLVNDFLISLTEYSLLQTGFGPSRISFASYLPLQTYTKYLNEAFEDLYNNLSDKVENNNIVQLWKLFIQNNSTDTLLADQIVDKENGDLGKNYFYSSGKLSKSFNTFDNYPLFVHRTYFDYDGRENKVLYQIASILEADNKLFIQYTKIDILGRGRYFTETVQKELTLKDNLLINIINSNKLEEVSIFESEMTETNPLIFNNASPIVETFTNSNKSDLLKNENGLIIIENVIPKSETIKIIEQAKDFIEETSFKQTAGSVSWAYGKQWMRINAMNPKQRESLITGKQLNGIEITQKMKDDFIKTGVSKGFPLYGYTTIDKNGNELPQIPQNIIDYLSSKGIDVSEYDASYNSIYDKSDNGSLIIHQDNTENNESPIITISLGRPMKFITYELNDSTDFNVADTNNTAFRIAVNAVRGEALKLNLIPQSAKDNNGNIKYGHFTPDTILKYAEEVDKKQGTQLKQFVIDKLKEQFKNAEKTEYDLTNGAVLVFSGNNRNVLHEIVFDEETNKKPMESGFPTLNINKAFKGLNQADRIVKTDDYRGVLTLRKVEGPTLTNVINEQKLIENISTQPTTTTEESTSNPALNELLVIEENEIPDKEGESFAEMQRRVIQNLNIKKRIEIAQKNNIIQGKSYSFSEIKKLFNNEKLFENEIYKELDNILQTSNLIFKFGSLNKGKKSINAYYNSINNSINIDTLVLQTPNLTTSDFKRILLHEIIHAATFINLKEGVSLTSTQKTALNNLNNLIDELKKDRDFFAQYGLTNANELLAELANEQFVDKLKKKTFSDNQSFFDKIISEIIKLLGLKTTAYDIVKESFNNLVNEKLQIVNQTTEVKPSVEITQNNYTKDTAPNNPTTGFIFTENAEMLDTDKNVSMTQAIIRTTKDGLKNLNALPIITKKLQVAGGQWSNSEEDFNEFKRLNTMLIKRHLSDNWSKLVFPQGFATDKAQLPTRFAEWLQKELLDNFGLITELNEAKTGLISKSINPTTKVKPGVETSSNVEINIYSGTGENSELSNFAIRPFTMPENLANFLKEKGNGDYFDINYKSVEQAFQNIKVSYNKSGFNDALDKDILSTTDGGKLRQLGKKVDLDVTKWDNDSLFILKELMKASFEQNSEGFAKLLATGNATFTHKYKGVEQDNGRFSKLLMEVRQELKPTIVDNTTLVANTQETQITYTPKGKATQTYTVRGSKIFNKAGKEVFTKDSIDRNKVFANVAVQQGRAVIVNYQDADYVVNTRNQIISVTTGKQMQWAENNGDRKNVLSLALNKFNALNSTTKIPRNTVEGTKNECLK